VQVFRAADQLGEHGRDAVGQVLSRGDLLDGRQWVDLDAVERNDRDACNPRAATRRGKPWRTSLFAGGTPAPGTAGVLPASSDAHYDAPFRWRAGGTPESLRISRAEEDSEAIVATLLRDPRAISPPQRFPTASGGPTGQRSGEEDQGRWEKEGRTPMPPPMPPPASLATSLVRTEERQSQALGNQEPPRTTREMEPLRETGFLALASGFP
jgi:hypothetical protein